MLKKKLLTSIALVIALTMVFASTVTAAPYKDIKIGDGVTTILCTDFDSGTYGWPNGEGGNHDIRADEEVNTEVGESEFGSNVGWTDKGTWLQWTVNVESDGKYKFDMWIASDNGSNEGIAMFYNDAKIGEVAFVEQEGWQVYSLYSFGEIEMKAGTQVIKAEWPAVGGINMSAIVVTCVEKTAAPVAEVAATVAVEAPAAEVVAPVAAAVTAPVVTVTAPATGDMAIIFVAALALTGVACVFVMRRNKKVSFK